jgi:hypothetical protein
MTIADYIFAACMTVVIVCLQFFFRLDDLSPFRQGAL